MTSNDAETPGIEGPEEDELISKSSLKKEALGFQAMAETLIELPNRFFNEMSMDDELRDAILVARRLDPRNARKRQVRFIAKLLANTDRTGIETTLDAVDKHNQQFQQVIQSVDKWCGQLIEGDPEITEELLDRFPALGRQKLRQLTRQATKHMGTEKAEASRAKLFRYIQQSVGS